MSQQIYAVVHVTLARPLATAIEEEMAEAGIPYVFSHSAFLV